MTEKLIFKDKETASQQAAQMIMQLILSSLQRKDICTVALSGGSSPVRLYEILSEEPYKEKIPWDKIHFFWGDDRYVPHDDDRSNFKLAMDTMLGKLPVPPGHVHGMPTETDAATDATAYEAELRKFFDNEGPAIDINIMGLGENGHTASLFPHIDILHDHTHWVVGPYIDEVKMHRITLTADALNQSKNILFLVFGESKADVLHQVLEGPYQPEELPAQLIKPVDGTVTWILDEAVAGKLKNKD